jgi:beta-lactamase class A
MRSQREHSLSAHALCTHSLCTHSFCAHALRAHSLVAAAAIVVALTLVGCVNTPDGSGPSSAASAPGNATASPAPAATPTASAEPTTAQADQAFAALETEYGARLGVFAIDTGTGTTLSWRSGDRFAYASTHKALSAAALLDEVGVEGLAETVPIDAADVVSHSPVTQQFVGGTMTLGEIAAAAVQQSDNTAANLMIERLGGPAGFGSALEEVGDAVTNVARLEPALNEAAPGDTRDTTTPRAFAENLRTYMLGGTLSADELCTLTGWMTQSNLGDTLIRASVPTDWIVADKSGSGGYGTRNDIAVLWPPSGAPLVMAVFSSRDSIGADANPNASADTNSTDELIARAAQNVVDALR